MVYLLFVWQSLPSEVPAHYNALGEVDRWGSKWEMLILPIIATVLWIGMTILEKYPHVYNYINLTEDNVRNQYLNVRRSEERRVGKVSRSWMQRGHYR